MVRFWPGSKGQSENRIIPEASTNDRCYIHAVNGKQVEAQGKYLDAVKIVAKHPDRAA
jgi:hypothetical protein